MYCIISLQNPQDRYSFQFIDITSCTGVNETVVMAKNTYNSIFAILVFVFALFNMRIANRFRSEGRVASAAIIFLVLGNIVFLLASEATHADEDPDGYIILYSLVVVYDFGWVLLITICLFFPRVSLSCIKLFLRKLLSTNQCTREQYSIELIRACCDKK